VTLIFGTIMTKFFNTNGFNEDTKSRLPALIAASLEVYNTISKELRPRPSRPHYLFNLRDVAKIFSGLLNAEARLVPTANQLVGMWAHEATRTFRDRLVDDDDRGWFDDLIKKQLQKHFKLKWSEVVSADRLIYVDFLQKDTRAYVEVKDMAPLKAVTEHFLEEFNNNTNKRMNLVMFMDAIEHVARTPRGEDHRV
jgi:dynein heavy chain